LRNFSIQIVLAEKVNIACVCGMPSAVVQQFTFCSFNNRPVINNVAAAGVNENQNDEKLHDERTERIEGKSETAETLNTK